MTLQQLAPFLPGILAFLAALLAGFLRQDGWTPYQNFAIAALFVVVATIVDVLLSGSLTGNWQADAVTLQASMTLLIGTSLNPLMQFLQSNVFTLPTQTPRTLASQDPQPIQLRKSLTTDTGGDDHSG